MSTRAQIAVDEMFGRLSHDQAEESRAATMLEEQAAEQAAERAAEVEAEPGPPGRLLGPCMWFALCTNDATTTRPHPILGNVPICDRCDAKVDQIAAAGRQEPGRGAS